MLRTVERTPGACRPSRSSLVPTRTAEDQTTDLPPALALMVQVHREIAAGTRPVPAELWIATGRR